MYKTKIDWAESSWNPVTGCLHDCEYCYARSMVHRFGGGTPDSIPRVLDAPVRKDNGRINPYPFGFAPTLHRYRLDMPAKWTDLRTIFVCSMADLFGEWVPDEWIRKVLDACRATPQHRYLFLTKNPKRYEAVLDHYFPPNMWFGWSQTGPMGDAMKHSTHHSIRSFVSIEPLLRPFECFNVRGLDWAIVGAETGNRAGKVVPKKEWVDQIAVACAANGVPLFMKESLRAIMGDDFRQEYPW